MRVTVDYTYMLVNLGIANQEFYGARLPLLPLKFELASHLGTRWLL